MRGGFYPMDSDSRSSQMCIDLNTPYRKQYNPVRERLRKGLIPKRFFMPRHL